MLVVVAACGGEPENPAVTCDPACPATYICTAFGCLCPGGTVECDGVCLDTSADPANCGACGHDCLGTTCVDATCLPERLAVVPNPPSAIALDGSDVVFATSGAVTSSGTVYRIPKAGGALEVVYRGLGVDPALAVTGGELLVADSAQVERCGAFASAGAIVTITDAGVELRSQGRRCARWLQPHGGELHWIEEAGTTFRTGDPGPWLARLPAGAAAADVPLRRHGPSLFGMSDLTLAGSILRWRGEREESVGALPITGGSPSALMPGGTIDAYAVDPTWLVYAWTPDSTALGLSLVRRSLATGEETTISGPLDQVRRVAFDDALVYWIGRGAAVWAAGLTPPFPRRMLNVTGARELAQDDTFLYVLVDVDDPGPARYAEVWRVRKPALASVAEEPPACPSSFVECLDGDFPERCTDVANDRDHCGDCATTCGAGEQCVAGACACAPTNATCGGGCVDLASDPLHCGACGRACVGGDCVGGDCKPYPVGELAHAACQDAAAIYYARGGAVRRFDKATGAAATLATLMYARDVAIDATRVYVAATSGLISLSNPGTIRSVPKDGSAAPIALYPDRPDPRQIAVAGDSVLWVEDAGPTTDSPVRLVHADAGGTAIRGQLAVTTLYPDAADDESRDLAIDGSTVYWLRGDSAQRRGAIVRIDLAAAVPVPALVVELAADPVAIAVAGGRLYVTTGGDDGAVLSVATTGGAIDVLAAGVVDARAIEVASDGVLYWVGDTSRSPALYRLAPGEVVPRVVQSRIEDATIVLPDGAVIYTVSGPDGIHAMTR